MIEFRFDTEGLLNWCIFCNIFVLVLVMGYESLIVGQYDSFNVKVWSLFWHKSFNSLIILGLIHALHKLNFWVNWEAFFTADVFGTRIELSHSILTTWTLTGSWITWLTSSRSSQMPIPLLLLGSQPKVFRFIIEFYHEVCRALLRCRTLSLGHETRLGGCIHIWLFIKRTFFKWIGLYLIHSILWVSHCKSQRLISKPASGWKYFWSRVFIQTTIGCSWIIIWFLVFLHTSIFDIVMKIWINTWLSWSMCVSIALCQLLIGQLQLWNKGLLLLLYIIAHIESIVGVIVISFGTGEVGDSKPHCRLFCWVHKEWLLLGSSSQIKSI